MFRAILPEEELVQIYLIRVVEVGTTYRLIIPRITGSFSLLCSLLIVYMIFRSSTRLDSIYHRIIFGLSIGDILSSASILITFTAVPRQGISSTIDAAFEDSPARYGNFSTCHIQGFFFLFGVVASHVYTASLCWYYYYVLVKAVSDRTIRKKIEPYLHSVPIVFGFILAMMALATANLNPGISWCTCTPIPHGCFDNCERGMYGVFAYAIAPLFIFFASLVLCSIMFCLLSVYTKVRSLKRIISEQEVEQEREGGEGNLSQEAVLPPALPQEQEQEQGQEQEQDVHGENLVHHQKRGSYKQNHLTNVILQRSLGVQRNSDVNEISQNASVHLIALRTAHFPANKNIAFQALVYVIPFFLTGAFPLSRVIAAYAGLHQASTMLIKLQLFIQPLQGFFNFLIFFGFKIYHQRFLNPSDTLGHVIGKLFCHSTADPIFISRLTIVEEGGNVSVRVQDEELLSIDNASLGNMNRVEDGLSTSSGVALSLPSPYDSEVNRSSGQHLDNSGTSGLSLTGFHFSSGFSSGIYSSGIYSSGIYSSGRHSSGRHSSEKDRSGNLMSSAMTSSSIANCGSDTSTVKK